MIDWGKEIRELVDASSASYEQRVTRTALKIGAVALFVLVVWRLLK